MRTLYRSSALALLIVTALVIAGCSNSHKASNAVRAADTFTSNESSYQGVQAFVDTLNGNKSSGMKAKHFPNGQLGDDTANIEGVRNGSIQVAGISSGKIASVDPQFGVYSLPYLITDVQDIKKYAASPAYQSLLKGLEKYGMHGLAMIPAGFQVVISKTPLRSSHDFKGQRIRVISSKAETATMRSLGATGVTMGNEQIYLALRQGAISGAAGSVPFILGQKMNEVAHYITLMNYECICDALVMNLKYWNSLSKSQKDAVNKAAAAAQNRSLSVVGPATEKGVNELKSKGVTVIPQLSDIAKVKTSLRDKVYPALSPTVGQQVVSGAEKAVGVTG